MPATPGTVQIYAAGLQKWQRGLIPLQTAGCFKALLVTEDYVPNLETHTNVTHITDEVYGDSWPQGGVVLSGVDVSINTGANQTQIGFAAINVSPASVAGGKRLVLYHDLPPDDADKTLFACITFDTPLSPVYGPVAIAAPDGVFRTGY